MALIINDTTIQKNSTTLEGVRGAQSVFKLTSAGNLLKPDNQPSWSVGNSTAGWIQITAGFTELLNFPVIYQANPSSAYTSNGRFTAPVSGVYMLKANFYCYGSTTSDHSYVSVWINGSSTRGTPSGSHIHRIRGHGVTGGYAYDMDYSEIKYMVAGDYASVFLYGSTNAYWHGSYSHFSGYMLG